MLRPKPLPPPSLALLTRPELDTEYVHFEAASEVPFDAAAVAFSPRNAWWLADCALLAYWPESEARDRFRAGGFEDAALVDGAGTQCYVAWTPDKTIVTFRGTQPTERVDLLRDVDFPKTAWLRPGEEVHQGFLRGLEPVWDEVRRLLTAHASRSLWFTGHSLGAALATLAADRWLHEANAASSVYVFGSPRVGDRAFVDGFNLRFAGRCFRYVNNSDVVTHLPPRSFAFGEVEAGLRFDDRGRAERAGALPALGEVAARSAAALGARVAAGFTSGGDLLPPFLVDHTPRRYATLVWNALVNVAA